jgi:hypothetical protein
LRRMFLTFFILSGGARGLMLSGEWANGELRSRTGSRAWGGTADGAGGRSWDGRELGAPNGAGGEERETRLHEKYEYASSNKREGIRRVSQRTKVGLGGGGAGARRRDGHESTGELGSAPQTRR